VNQRESQPFKANGVFLLVAQECGKLGWLPGNSKSALLDSANVGASRNTTRLGGRIRKSGELLTCGGELGREEEERVYGWRGKEVRSRKWTWDVVAVKVVSVNNNLGEAWSRFRQWSSHAERQLVKWPERA